MNSSYNYKTFYIGTPKELEECPMLYFFQTSCLSGDLSFDNLDGLKSDILENSGIALPCYRDTSTDLFVKDLKGLVKYEFDLLVFCKSDISEGDTDNPIIGYTVFSELNKTYTYAGNTFESIKISMTFNRIEDTESSLVVQILNTFKVIQTEIDLTGDELYNYPTAYSFEIPDTISYPRYTGRLIDLEKDRSLTVLTDSGVGYWGTEETPDYSRFYVNTGLDIDQATYDKVFLGVYKNDIVLFRFSMNSGSYSICSLTRKNKFGLPYDYLSGYIDTTPVLGCALLYYANSYIVFWDSYNAKYIVYLLGDNTYLEYPKSNSETSGSNYIVIDKGSSRGSYRFMTDTDLFSEISRTCITPYNDTTGEQMESIDKKNFEYLEKINSWWLIKNINSGMFYYVSPFGCIKTSEKMDLINDRLFRTKSGVFFPIEFGHVYSYPFQKNKNVKDVSDSKTVGIKIDSTWTWESLGHKEECLLDGLRRKPIRTSNVFPSSIIGSLYGLIFYLGEDNLLYCY